MWISYDIYSKLNNFVVEWIVNIEMSAKEMSVGDASYRQSCSRTPTSYFYKTRTNEKLIFSFLYSDITNL